LTDAETDMRLAIALLVAALPPVALADHVELTDSGTQHVAGGLAPLSGGDAHIRSVELSVRFEDSTVRIRSGYVVSIGVSETAEWAVPLRQVATQCQGEGEEDAGCDGSRPTAAPDLARVPETVRLAVAGKDAGPCRLAVAPSIAWAERPAGGDGWRPAMQGHEGWCVFSVAVTRGEAVPVVLEYAGPADYEDVAGAFGARGVHWTALPAGSPRPVVAKVELDAGRLDGLVTVSSPEGVAWSGGRARLSRDARGLALEASVDPSPLLESSQLAHAAYPGLEQARASTVLKPQAGNAYGAEKAIDRDPASAWCEGAPGPGVGEWLEVTLTPPAGAETCEAVGWAVVPGYAKSEASWLGNARVKRFRLSRCDDPKEGIDVALDGSGPRGLTLVDRPDRGAVLVRTGGPSAPQWERDPLRDAVRREPTEGAARPPRARKAACVRLTILEIVPGKHADACISELRPVVECRSDP
jgi:hypothetical protein